MAGKAITRRSSITTTAKDIPSIDVNKWTRVYSREIAPFLAGFDSKLDFAKFIVSLDADRRDNARARSFRSAIGPAMAEYETAGEFFGEVVKAETELGKHTGPHCTWGAEVLPSLDEWSTSHLADPKWVACPSAALDLEEDSEEPAAVSAALQLEHLQDGLMRYVHKDDKLTIRRLLKGDANVLDHFLRSKEKAILKAARKDADKRHSKTLRADRSFRDLELAGKIPDAVGYNVEHDHTPLVLRHACLE